MSKLKPQKFTIEEFQEQKDWIGNLFSPLNSLIQDLVAMFNSNLTVNDNLYQEIKELSFNNDATNFPLRFRTKFLATPKGLSVIYCYDSTSAIMNSSTPWVSWSYKNNEVTISSITNLTASHNYVMRLHLIYG